MEIPSFNELTQHIVLDGDKIKLDDLLNQPIIDNQKQQVIERRNNNGNGKISK